MKRILFNEPSGMLGSVLSGQKTMTRRLGGIDKEINGRPNEWDFLEWDTTGGETAEGKNVPATNGAIFEHIDGAPEPYRILCKPRYNVGDMVYVGEAYAIDDKPEVHYKLDVDEPAKGQIKWKNPMFMPESAARRWLKIKSVQVERMWDISYSDCFSEGIEKSIDENTDIQVFNYPTGHPCSNPKEAFEKLIDFVSKKEIWKLNLWSFVYEFERVENPAKTEKP